MPVELMYCTAAKSSTTVAGSPLATARSYAAVRVSAAWPSISPDRTMTAPPGRTRTSASHVVFTRASFFSFGGSTVRSASAVAAAGPHDEPDRVPRSLGRHVHRVHHVADQEQPPAPRCLFAGELGGEIGFRAGAGLLGDAALVGDRDHDVAVGRRHFDVHRHLGLVAVPVLDGVP